MSLFFVYSLYFIEQNGYAARACHSLYYLARREKIYWLSIYDKGVYDIYNCLMNGDMKLCIAFYFCDVFAALIKKKCLLFYLRYSSASLFLFVLHVCASSYVCGRMYYFWICFVRFLKWVRVSKCILLRLGWVILF